MKSKYESCLPWQLGEKGCKIYTPASNIPETLAGTSYLTTPSRDEHEAVWMRTKCISLETRGINR
jgi:hypothetical protein